MEVVRPNRLSDDFINWITIRLEGICHKFGEKISNSVETSGSLGAIGLLALIPGMGIEISQTQPNLSAGGRRQLNRQRSFSRFLGWVQFDRVSVEGQHSVETQ